MTIGRSVFVIHVWDLSSVKALLSLGVPQCMEFPRVLLYDWLVEVQHTNHSLLYLFGPKSSYFK